MVPELKEAFLPRPCTWTLNLFTWETPNTHVASQRTWTVPPQEFRDNPHLSGQAVATNLCSLDLSPSTPQQYVDGLLPYSPPFHCPNYTLTD